MIIDFMPSSSWRKESHAVGQPRCLAMHHGPLNIGSAGLRNAVFQGSWTENVLAVALDWNQATLRS